MSSILVLPNGRKLEVDRIFMDGGSLPVYSMIGGRKTIMERGTQPKVSIYEKGKGLFTLDEKPCTPAVLQPWLDDPEYPEEIKTIFRKFLADRSKGKLVGEKLAKIRLRKPAAKETRRFTPEDAGLSSERAERV